jgi:hypothetical protein
MPHLNCGQASNVMSVLQALVLTTREQRKPDGTVITRMLVVVAQTIHVLVATLAISNATGERPQPPLGLSLDFPHLTLADHAKRGV